MRHAKQARITKGHLFFVCSQVPCLALTNQSTGCTVNACAFFIDFFKYVLNLLSFLTNLGFNRKVMNTLIDNVYIGTQSADLSGSSNTLFTTIAN